MIKVLIVDDSAFMRKVLSDLFVAAPDFVVVDVARNGNEAIEKVQKLQPDVITMDVEMPIMNGIQALEAIMKIRPTPVVMISSLTRTGAEATIQALEAGAVDFVAKTAGPISKIDNIIDEILEKCREASKVDMKRLVMKPSPEIQWGNLPTKKPSSERYSLSPSQSAGERIVAIGTSTGGPRALQEILTQLPTELPSGVVIVQHMPPGFTKSLAERLNTLSALKVKEAEHDDVIQNGVAYIAPGDYHMVLAREGSRTVIKLNQELPIGGHRPSVDPMLESVAKIYAENAIGVILTGMGHDGSKGLKTIKERRGTTIAEDASTTVVFGMPKSAIELGVVDKILPLHNIAAEITRQLQSRHGGV
ncbi:protein-glutamate methylesterase/protein-glutamine glutaminase [Acetonema longum]|nr:chemotaxis response regulator protein-glutamate methylesterase [Acetonema longum]